MSYLNFNPKPLNQSQRQNREFQLSLFSTNPKHLRGLTLTIKESCPFSQSPLKSQDLSQSTESLVETFLLQKHFQWPEARLLKAKWGLRCQQWRRDQCGFCVSDIEAPWNRRENLLQPNKWPYTDISRPFWCEKVLYRNINLFHFCNPVAIHEFHCSLLWGGSL